MPDIMKMGKNPNYLGSWDLEELPNREAVLIIDQIRDEEVVTNGKTEVCTVAHWTDKAFKPMILNVTNKKAIARLYKTKDTEKLKGKAVAIGIDRVKAFGDVHDALRIRHRVPQVQSKSAHKCADCGQPITDFGGMNADQVVEYRIKKYGKALCNDCAKALAEGAQK